MGDDDFSWDTGSSYNLDDNFDSGWDNIATDATDNSTDFNYLDGLDEYGNGPSGGGDDWLNSNVDSGIDDYGSGGGGSGNLGGGSGSGSGSYPWTSALMSGGGALLKGAAEMYKDKQDWKARTEFMKAQLAEQEKYYQLHGKQLEDAFGKYKGYYKAPGSTPSATSSMGLLAGSGGPSGYFK